jgi:hypothetical protein
VPDGPDEQPALSHPEKCTTNSTALPTKSKLWPADRHVIIDLINRRRSVVEVVLGCYSKLGRMVVTNSLRCPIQKKAQRTAQLCRPSQSSGRPTDT